MGISGKGTAALLASQGADMTLFDGNKNYDTQALRKELGLGDDVRIITGELKDEDLDGVEILALSPGVSYFAPDIEKAKSRGIRVLGEIEIAYESSKGRIAAITGTNGKTTTTTLVGDIMKAWEDETFVVGNIGTSYASVAAKTSERSIVVAEISSFQLESIQDFHPRVSAILNITPDHLDRHGSFENYAKAKLLIAKNQTPEEVCVVNYDDEYLRKLSSSLVPKVMFFSRKVILDEGIYLDGGDIILKNGGKSEKLVSCADIQLKGVHNIENVMAAAGVAVSMGVDTAVIAKVIRGFKAVEHRIEYVCTKKGVEYFNDSKGTNPDAAEKAVSSMTAPTILIAGGYDKGSDFTDWIKGFDGKVKLMILIGQTARKIYDTALSCGFNDLIMARDLEEAVKIASEKAACGDAVLLSPACASWGQFKNYEQRGTMFKEFARALED